KARRVDVGYAPPLGFGGRPDRDQASDHGDRATDPDPRDERVDVDAEGRGGRVLQVLLLDVANRQSLKRAERLLRLHVLGRDALTDPHELAVGLVDQWIEWPEVGDHRRPDIPPHGGPAPDLARRPAPEAAPD